MAAFDRFNAAGQYDEHEPPFTEAELEHALDWRQRVWPDPRERRRDRCPHTPKCDTLADCVEAIAWYFRHRAILDRMSPPVAVRHAGAQVRQIAERKRPPHVGQFHTGTP